MPKKPTYKALEKRISELNVALLERTRIEEILRESEKKFKTIFEKANDLIVYLEQDGTVIDLNPKFTELFGYKPEEVIGRNFAEFDFFSQEDFEKSIELFKGVTEGRPVFVIEFKAFSREGTVIYIEGNAKLIKKKDKTLGVLIIIRDITERKKAEIELETYKDYLEDLVEERTNELTRANRQLQQEIVERKNAEEALKKSREELEIKVAERTQNLNETNTALRVLLNEREKDRAEFENIMMYNIRENIQPHLKKLGKTRLKDRQKAHLEIVRTHLNEIASPFTYQISSKFLKLTPGEILVANLIKQAKTTKEIAEMLSLSERTIDYHRANIRKKIGIRNKRANLRSVLLSIL